MAHNPKCFVTCLDCGNQNRIPRSALDRAARVRCSRCGGPVELSRSASRDLAIGVTRFKESKDRREGV